MHFGLCPLHQRYWAIGTTPFVEHRRLRQGTPSYQVYQTGRPCDL